MKHGWAPGLKGGLLVLSLRCHPSFTGEIGVKRRTRKSNAKRTCGVRKMNHLGGTGRGIENG